MSIQFNYKDINTDEVVTLNSVDEFCCKYFSIEVDEDNFSSPYMDLNAFAIGASYNAPQSTITPEVALEAIDKNTGGWSLLMLNFFREVFTNHYTFTAWR